MSHEEQIEYDLRVYGVAVERLKEDGTIERIDPTTIRYIKRQDPGAFFPIPNEDNTTTPITKPTTEEH